MARSTLRPPSGSRASAPSGGGRLRAPPGPRRRGAAGGADSGAVLPEDLLDVEAPSEGGTAVNTAAYAVPPETAGGTATSSDLLDVEAPAQGGAKVDTAAYARGGRGRKPKPQAAADPSPAAAEAQAAPPPAAPDQPPGSRADRLDDPGAAPPFARSERGGGDADGDPVDRAAAAALRLAADRPWSEVTLRDVAREARVTFAALYARAPGRRALLLALSARLDREALERLEGDDAPAARDRLFEAFMSRLEVMAPHRDALLAVGRAEGVALAPALPRTARALAEGSGVHTSGPRGALRLAALTAAWGRTLQVWRDDEGALNRTMAEIDKLLVQADRRLARVGAGF